jgi:hypothetical protein
LGRATLDGMIAGFGIPVNSRRVFQRVIVWGGEANGYVRQQYGELAKVFAGPPTREIFSVDILETTPGPTVAARVLTLPLKRATEVTFSPPLSPARRRSSAVGRAYLRRSSP